MFLIPHLQNQLSGLQKPDILSPASYITFSSAQLLDEGENYSKQIIDNVEQMLVNIGFMSCCQSIFCLCMF